MKNITVRNLKSTVLFAATLFGVVTSAFGANADVLVTPTSVPTEVSVSRQCTGSVCTLTNYWAVELVVTNATTNVINQVVLEGSTDVTGVTPDQAANFVESIPAGLCKSTMATPNSVKCDIGQLRSSARFVVIFSSPPSDNSSTYSNPKIEFRYTGTFSNAASPTTPTAEGGVFSGMASATLITTDAPAIATSLTTFIASFGGTFYTGTNATAFEFDPSTTKLKVPDGLGLTNPASIKETVQVGGLTNDTLATLNTDISIKSSSYFSKPVTIELRRDESTIRVFKAIDRVPVYYTSDLGEPWQVTNFLVPSCTDSTYYSPAAGPSPTWPVCIDSRIGITKKTVLDPPVTADDIGDWLIIFKVLQNGKASW